MYRVRTILTGVAGSPWYSNFYFDPSAEFGEAGLTTAVHDYWASLKGGIHTGISIQVQPDIAVIDPELGEITDYVSSPVAVVSGTDSTRPLPYQTQVLTRFNTGGVVAGRRVIGHTFTPGVCEYSLGADGQFTTTWVAELQNAANTLRTYTAGGLISGLCVWSRPKHVGGVLVRAGSTHLVNGCATQAKPAVLRSRRD